MDNQHREIKGYRDFDEGTVFRINQLKKAESRVLEIIQDLDKDASENDTYETDKRWQSIGVTDIQKGFMALIRSHARPD